MRRWFLSYNSQDSALAEAVEGRLKSALPDARIYFAPKSNRAGGFWLPALADAVAEADAFLLLVGEKGLGPWQVLEYYEALDKRVRLPGFPVILVLLQGQPAPGLPFLRQLHRIVTPDPASGETLAKLMDAVAGKGSAPAELWRNSAPYRGLSAMTEADTDFFFGRARETVEVLKALADGRGRLPVLLGNSGVGKSSLAQAGVLGALKRQAWPEGANASAWPRVFEHSRQWCFLRLQPGTDPLKALVDPFLATWELDPLDPQWEKLRNDWVNTLLEGEASLVGLLDATERRYDALGQPKPLAFFLYVDQGEELYVRAEEWQQRRFSELLAEALNDARLTALMSLRSDFTGELQKDKPLFDVHRKIDVVPLREAELREVVSRPASLLGARFESDTTAVELARKTAEESVRDAGALPLLSYLLDDMWTAMVKREPADGTLRLPAQALELGGVLAERAEKFVADHPKDEERLRRLLTLKLATVRENSDPTRRRALRSEFSDEEWRLVSELADHPHRLLVTATPEGGEPYAEVAHEAIFRRWEKLRQWIASQREFLVWKSGLEADRRRWENVPDYARNDALLMGLALDHARSWLASRANDLAAIDQEFICFSAKAETERRDSARKLEEELAHLRAEKEAQERQAEEEERREALAWEILEKTPQRLDAFLGRHPGDEHRIRRALLKLVTIDEDDNPRRRTASRAEFSEFEWTMIAELAEDPPVVSVSSSDSNTLVEVLHEAIFRRWDKLRQWIAAEREFLIWKSGLEADRRIWEAAGDSDRTDALLTGLALAYAQRWLVRRAEDLSRADREFIEASLQRDTLLREEREKERTQRERLRRRLLQLALAALVLVTALLGFSIYQTREAQQQRTLAAERAASEQVAREDAQRNFEIATEAVSILFDLAGGMRSAEGPSIASLRHAQDRLQSAVERLIEVAPEDLSLQRTRALMLISFGDTYRSVGDLTGALSAYEDSLATVRRLIMTDPSNTTWARDVSASLEKIGDVKRLRGDLAGALASYQEGQATLQRLIDQNPDDVGFQRDVSYNLLTTGDLKQYSGDISGALAAYEESLAIGRRLVAADPVNAGVSRDVSLALERIGDAELLTGDAAGALAAYEEGLAIHRRLAASDSGNILWQRDVSVSLDKIGNMKLRGGDAAGALAAYEEALTIRRALAATDSGNVQLLSDLAYGLYKTASAATGSRRMDAVNEALAILERLKAQGALTAGQESWPETFRALLTEEPPSP